MSTGAAVALGAGAGLVGGLVVADAIDDAREDAYAEGMWETSTGQREPIIL